MAYLWVKWLHILSSTLLFGTGFGIAFFMWMAHRRRDPALIAGTARIVAVADACFTAPAALTQFITGLWLVHRLGIGFAAFWVEAALVLFFVVGACWLPVLWLQVRARDLALAAVADNVPLAAPYYCIMRWWFWLGWPAFLGMLAIFWLMVSKPA